MVLWHNCYSQHVCLNAQDACIAIYTTGVSPLLFNTVIDQKQKRSSVWWKILSVQYNVKQLLFVSENAIYANTNAQVTHILHSIAHNILQSWKSMWTRTRSWAMNKSWQLIDCKPLSTLMESAVNQIKEFKNLWSLDQEKKVVHVEQNNHLETWMLIKLNKMEVFHMFTKYPRSFPPWLPLKMAI